MNNCVFIGRIASDITMRVANTANGSMAIATFNLAVNRSRGNETDFFTCTAFGKTAENIKNFFFKGNRIGINASAQLNKWTDKDGNNRQSVQFVVNSFDFIDKRGEAPSSNSAPTSNQGEGFMDIPDGSGDGLPFN